MIIKLQEKVLDKVIGKIEQLAIWFIVNSVAKGTPQPRYYEMATIHVNAHYDDKVLVGAGR